MDENIAATLGPTLDPQSPWFVEFCTALHYSAPDGGMMDCVVKFASMAEAIPFTASRQDSMPHGRELFERITSGEFGDISPYTAPPLQVPQSVSKAQGKIVLKRHSLLQRVKDAVAASGEDSELSIWWEDSTTWERTNPYLVGLGQVLGLTSLQIDQLFIEAAGI